MFPIHHLTVIVDHTGRVEGANASTEHADGRRVEWPYRPGPFDTPEEVLAALKSRLDLQLTLW